jgi:hypothetical protein
LNARPPGKEREVAPISAETRDRRIRRRAVPDEGYGGDARSASVLLGLGHRGDEVDKQPQHKRRRKKDRQWDQAAIVGQIAAIERRVLLIPFIWKLLSER